jgi:hypothetical protein
MQALAQLLRHGRQVLSSLLQCIGLLHNSSEANKQTNPSRTSRSASAMGPRAQNEAAALHQARHSASIHATPQQEQQLSQAVGQRLAAAASAFCRALLVGSHALCKELALQ